MNHSRIAPGPGQESVWDYPRPPRLEPSKKHIEVVFNGVQIADTRRAMRVLETSHPPVYYIPRADIRMEYLSESLPTSFCEFKGRAGYMTLAVGDRRVENAGWFYADPTPAFAAITNYIAFYPGKMDVCRIEGENVQAQAGNFYGGWITGDIVGPFKGESGDMGMVSGASGAPARFQAS